MSEAARPFDAWWEHPTESEGVRDMSLLIDPSTPAGRAYLLVGELLNLGRISTIEAEAIRAPLMPLLQAVNNAANR